MNQLWHNQQNLKESQKRSDKLNNKSNDKPSAIRYPRGTGLGSILPTINEKIEIGKSKIIQEGNKLAILNFGARLSETLKAAENLKKKELKTKF